MAFPDYAADAVGDWLVAPQEVALTSPCHDNRLAHRVLERRLQGHELRARAQLDLRRRNREGRPRVNNFSATSGATSGGGASERAVAVSQSFTAVHSRPSRSSWE